MGWYSMTPKVTLSTWRQVIRVASLLDLAESLANSFISTSFNQT